MRSGAASFNSQYLLVSLESSSSCLRLLHGLSLSYIFPPITFFRWQFLRNMWPILLAFLRFIACQLAEYYSLQGICASRVVFSPNALHSLHRASWHSSATLTEGFPCFIRSCKTNARVKPAKTGHGPHSSKLFVFFLSCKANARVTPAKMGHGPHSSKIFVLIYVLFVLCRSVRCLCVNVYCTTATGWLPNCSEQIYHIISYHISYHIISYIISHIT